MNKAFEKILKKIEEKRNKYQRLADGSNYDGWNEEDIKYSAKAEMCEELKEIVQEVAEEYNNGWIACSERLPEENKDGWTHLILSIKTGEVIFGFWHNEEMGFCKHFRDGVCRVGGVIAWQPLPQPFQPKGE